MRSMCGLFTQNISSLMLEVMLRELLPELFTTCTVLLPLPCNERQRSMWHHCLLVVGLNMVLPRKIKLQLNFCAKTNIMLLGVSWKDFLQCNGRWMCWTKFWRKSNEREMPVGLGRCAATTTSNALSSWHLVTVKSVEVNLASVS